jgi:hypothetical protein
MAFGTQTIPGLFPAWLWCSATWTPHSRMMSALFGRMRLLFFALAHNIILCID